MAWQELAPKVISDLTRDLGVTPEVAAGIVGQLGYESDGLQGINERQPVVPGSRGGFGWAQWTGPRRKQFEAWSADQGLDAASPEANYGFLVHELKNTPESRVLEKLQGVSDPQQAGKIFTDTFLRPGIPAYDKRASWTEKAMNAIIPAAQASEDWWSAAPIVEEPAAAGGADSWWQGAPLVEEGPKTSGGGAGQGFMMGLQDPIDAGAQMLRRAVPEGVGQSVDRFGNWLSDAGFPVSRSEGVQGIDTAINERNRQYEQGREQQGRGGFDWARMGGNLASAIPMLATAPASAPTLLGRSLLGGATGGALGALSPVIGQENQEDFGSEKAGQIGLGAGLGAAAAPVMSGLARIISPKASLPGSAAKALQAEGVQLTPGQALGGALMRAEDKAMSLPIMGDAIRAARTRGNEQLNRAVYNRVLEPIGKTTSKIGREAVDDVTRIVSQSYDDVLGKVRFAPDKAFARDIQKIQQMASGLPRREANAFISSLDRDVIKPLSVGRAVDGMTFKRVESQLGERAQQFLKSTDAYQNDVGRALIEVQKSLRENLVRMNPQAAAELKATNTAFANLVRLQQAAGKIGAQEGVFTPQQLAQAVRQSDRSARKGSYARGGALMQDLSDAAQSRMLSKIPDSGTTERLAMGAGALMAGSVSPAIPAGLAAGAIPYLPGAVRAVSGAALNRPASAQSLAQALRNLPAGAFGVLAGQQ